MQIYDSAQAVAPSEQRSVVTIGNFDGIHLGHQALIGRCVAEAKARNLRSVVMSFRPHPVKVLFPERNIKRLFSYQDQQEALTAMGVDVFVVQAFSRALSELSPIRFLNEILLKPLNPQMLVVGYDFAFGAHRQGSIPFLKNFCEENQIDLHIESPVRWQGEIISSSLLRRWIEEGEMKRVNHCLGRSFYLRGVVEKGAGRGKQIGFPTANIFTDTETFPRKGVYISKTWLHGKPWLSVTNVGDNPTFGSQNRRPIQVETHILDFDQDIYGDSLKVEFIDYLRPEKKFSGIEELVAQIGQDVRAARDYHAALGSDF